MSRPSTFPILRHPPARAEGVDELLAELVEILAQAVSDDVAEGRWCGRGRAVARARKSQEKRSDGEK